MNRNDQLRKEADAARRDFAETLQEDINEQSNSKDDNGAVINTARFLMQFLKDDKITELKKGSRVVKEEPAVYEEELENLTALISTEGT